MSRETQNESLSQLIGWDQTPTSRHGASRCSKCGQNIQPGDLFCRHCGAKLRRKSKPVWIWLLLLGVVALGVLYSLDVFDRFFSSEEVASYKELVRQESEMAADPLPSSCAAMAKQWQEYVDKYPESRLLAAAIEKQRSWRAREEAEIKRGFVITLVKADIQPKKEEQGGSAGGSAGGQWDAGIFEADLLPDVYAQVFMEGTVSQND